MVDTGLMRKNEFKYTYNLFKKKYNLNVKLLDASKLFFLKKLKNIHESRKKEKLSEIYLLKFLKKSQKNIKI